MVNTSLLAFISSGFSSEGLIVISVNALFNFINSLNVSWISETEKLVLRFFGFSFCTFGASASFGPPLGDCILAQLASVHKLMQKPTANNHTLLKVPIRPLVIKRYFLEEPIKEFLKVPQIALF
jgi:hypothetical protein